jgi:histidyl-tRNA synthetase
MLCGEPPAGRRPIALVPVGAGAEAEMGKLAERLRGAGLRVDLAYSGNMSRRMKRANRVAAVASVLVGDDELTRGVATVRNMDSGGQVEVSLTSLEEYLAQYR